MTPAALLHTARSLSRCADDLRRDCLAGGSPGSPGAAQAVDTTEPAYDRSRGPDRTDAVTRLLRDAAERLAYHARVLDGIEEELSMLRRRTNAATGIGRDIGRDIGRGVTRSVTRSTAVQLNDLERRRTREVRAVVAALDESACALLPGADRLEPTTILRRLGGSTPIAPRSFFGRAPVDRRARVRALADALRRGRIQEKTLIIACRPTRGPLTTRDVRLARMRRRLVTDRTGGAPVSTSPPAPVPTAAPGSLPASEGSRPCP